MADPTGVLYADTSALVKLAVEEAETHALRLELTRWDAVATSVITEIELARAVARARERGATTLDDVAVWTITAALLELELTAEIRRAAAVLRPTAVHSLDAIHRASLSSVAIVSTGRGTRRDTGYGVRPCQRRYAATMSPNRLPALNVRSASATS